MKVVTLNIHDNAQLSQLGKLASKSDIICLQEVHHNIIKSWDLVAEGKYFVGTHKIGTGADWNIIYWNNEKTANGTMGLAVLWSKDIIAEKKGAYTFNSTEGSVSETRGLPWIKARDKDNNVATIYSYHSTSAGDNTNHVSNVNLLMTTMMDKTNDATLGDFNMDAEYYRTRIANGLDLCSSPANEPSRPQSGRNLDYCVSKADLQVEFKERLDVSGSDHRPMLFHIVQGMQD